MAARKRPDQVQVAHKPPHYLVAKSDWSEDSGVVPVWTLVLLLIATRGPIGALIIDDTSMPKTGRHSVDMARQYCGQLGRQDYCQVAVGLFAAHGHASLPISYRMYLPRGGTDDPERRAVAGLHVLFFRRI